MEFNKHYINKSHTKHYYLGHIFDNFEWKEFISGITIQGIHISAIDKNRKIPNLCERWYNQDGNKNIVRPCKNKAFYKSETGLYFCKYCAHEINKTNPSLEFSKITDN